MSSTICQHIEAKLPQMRDGDMPRIIPSEAAARSTVSFHDTINWTHDEKKFVELMRNYGFTEKWDLDLLVAKYYRNLSDRDIVKEFGYITKNTVGRRLRAIRKELVKRGFKQELE